MASAIAEFFSSNREALIAALVLVAIWVFYRLATRALKRYVLGKSLKADDARNFLLIWRYIWLGVGIVFVIVAFSGSLAGLGVSAAFLGLIMGWSLQAPVTGIAAWLMVIVKRPFKIGDRVIIAGITGDVVDINLTHIMLNQVGGTIGGEERSGRGVMIPNATLFSQVIYNYTSESRYLLDEVLVSVTFDSDLAVAEKLLLDAAEEATEKIIQRTGEKPFVRMGITEHGVRMRLRYKAEAKDRQRISSDITRGVLHRVRGESGVSFAYPHTEIVYKR